MIVAALFTQRVASADMLLGATFDAVLDLHVDSGPTWQLVTIQAPQTSPIMAYPHACVLWA